MNPSDQASCLCYVTGSYVGPTFDYDVAACISTAAAMGDTSLLSEFEGITSFCADFAPASSVPSNPSPSPASSSIPASSPVITSAPPTPTNGGGNGLADCSPFWSLLTSCINESPGFTNFDVTTQAACLCYSNSVWVPNNFDNAASACATAASMIGSVQIASDASGLDSFCGQVGPVTLTGSSGSSGSSTFMPTFTMPRPMPTTTTTKNAAVPRATGLAQAEVCFRLELDSLWLLQVVVVSDMSNSSFFPPLVPPQVYSFCCDPQVRRGRIGPSGVMDFPCLLGTATAHL